MGQKGVVKRRVKEKMSQFLLGWNSSLRVWMAVLFVVIVVFSSARVTFLF